MERSHQRALRYKQTAFTTQSHKHSLFTSIEVSQS